MSHHFFSQIRPQDHRAVAQLDALLQKEGIQRDANLDYILGLYDDDYRLLATGSCFQNTLRCMAVDSNYQGQGLLNQIVSELIQFQYQRGNTHIFLCTKCEKAPFFANLNFHEIARVEKRIVFMENRPRGFSDYLDRLCRETEASGLRGAVQGAAVLNANPFTVGHQYLLEQASSRCDVLHVFIVSEDRSLIPFAVRQQLVREGCAHLHNLVFHHTDSYMISGAAFPSYFLKDSDLVIHAHGELDIAVFIRIAHALGICCRFAGEEPFSKVTGIYNQIMAEKLPAVGIACSILPRLEKNGKPVSASQVRKLLKNGELETLGSLVPPSTLEYFLSPEAEPVLANIRNAQDVLHY